MPTDYNKLDDGRPTAAHTWEEQFHTMREGGLKGPPPASYLESRIEQLEAAITNYDWTEHKARNGWRREIEWRRKQLEQLKSMEDSDVGDTEPAV